MIGELHSAVPETCVVFILYVRSFQNVSSLTPLVSDRGVEAFDITSTYSTWSYVQMAKAVSLVCSHKVALQLPLLWY